MSLGWVSSKAGPEARIWGQVVWGEMLLGSTGREARQQARERKEAGPQYICE